MTLTDADAVELGRAALNLLDLDGESREFWGEQFPRCPGHSHPAGFEADERTIWLRCPQTGVEFRRVTV